MVLSLSLSGDLDSQCEIIMWIIIHIFKFGFAEYNFYLFTAAFINISFYI